MNVLLAIGLANIKRSYFSSLFLALLRCGYCVNPVKCIGRKVFHFTSSMCAQFYIPSFFYIVHNHGLGHLFSLQDGLGDTIRVSLTEPPEEEIDPCRRLANLGMQASKLQKGVVGLKIII